MNNIYNNYIYNDYIYNINIITNFACCIIFTSFMNNKLVAHCISNDDYLGKQYLWEEMSL